MTRVSNINVIASGETKTVSRPKININGVWKDQEYIVNIYNRNGTIIQTITYTDDFTLPSSIGGNKIVGYKKFDDISQPSSYRQLTSGWNFSPGETQSLDTIGNNKNLNLYALICDYNGSYVISSNSNLSYSGIYTTKDVDITISFSKYTTLNDNNTRPYVKIEKHSGAPYAWNETNVISTEYITGNFNGDVNKHIAVENAHCVSVGVYSVNGTTIGIASSVSYVIIP